jgi:hypothetical protein
MQCYLMYGDEMRVAASCTLTACIQTTRNSMAPLFTTTYFPYSAQQVTDNSIECQSLGISD